MLAQLEQSALESPFAAKMAVMLAQGDTDGLGTLPASAEPLPHIDYHLIYSLITLAGYLDKHQLKPFDYLIDARKDYYRSHSNFQAAFACLQDTRAYGLLLEQENKKLAKLGSAGAKKLESNKIALRKNNHALYRCLLEVDQRRQKRDEITTSFSQMKYVFVNDQMPQLVYVGKKAYRRFMELKGKLNT